MTSPRIRAVMAAGTALVVISAHGSTVTADPTPDAWTAAKVVAVGDNHFRPRAVSIRAGNSVTWRWRGRRRHDVRFTSGRQRPRGCRIQRRGGCSRRFGRRGTYRYVCTLHGSMTGRVAVVR